MTIKQFNKRPFEYNVETQQRIYKTKTLMIMYLPSPCKCFLNLGTSSVHHTSAVDPACFGDIIGHHGSF